MKSVNASCLFILAAILLAACSNRVFVEKAESADLADYNTFAWVETQPNEKDKKSTTLTSMEMNIRDDVIEELLDEGWIMESQNPGVLVSFDRMRDRSLVQDTDPVYLSNYSPGYYNPYTGAWSPLTYPSNFMGWDTDFKIANEATVFITLTDVDSNKQLWQGYTTVRIGNDGVQANEVKEATEDVPDEINPGSYDE